MPQTNETDSTCYRGGMATHIQMFLLDDAMPKNDVISLLGNPDKEDLNQVEYTLGMCSGLGMDYDGLVIRFDNDDKLIETTIVQHWLISTSQLVVRISWRNPPHVD